MWALITLHFLQLSVRSKCFPHWTISGSGLRWWVEQRRLRLTDSAVIMTTYPTSSWCSCYRSWRLHKFLGKLTLKKCRILIMIYLAYSEELSEMMLNNTYQLPAMSNAHCICGKDSVAGNIPQTEKLFTPNCVSHRRRQGKSFFKKTAVCRNVSSF